MSFTALYLTLFICAHLLSLGETAFCCRCFKSRIRTVVSGRVKRRCNEIQKQRRNTETQKSERFET